VLLGGALVLVLYNTWQSSERDQDLRALRQDAAVRAEEERARVAVDQLRQRLEEEGRRVAQEALRANQQAQAAREAQLLAAELRRQLDQNANVVRDAEQKARQAFAAQLSKANESLREERRRREAAEEAARQAQGNPQAVKELEARQQQEIKAIRAAVESKEYAQGVALAGWELQANHLDRAAKYLRDCPPGPRGWEWHYLNRVCGGDSPPTITPKNPVRNLAFAAGGKRLATAAASGAVTYWDRTTGAEVQAVGVGAGFRTVVFSGDGGRFATARLGGGRVEIKLWDATGRELALLKAAPPGSRCVGLDAQGKRLATAAPDFTVTVWDDASKQLFTLPAHKSSVAVAAFSPDGKRFVTAGGLSKNPQQTAEIHVWDADTGRPTLKLATPARSVRSLAFSPDGATLASSGGTDRAVRLWNPAAKDEAQALLRTIPDPGVQPTVLAFGADGKRLFVGGIDGAIKIWDPATGQPAGSLEGHTLSVNALAVSPDGVLLGSVGADGAPRCWRVAPHRLARGLKAHTGPVHGVAFSPDGNVLATVGADRTVTLWDAQTGKAVRTLQGLTRPVARAVFDRQGRRLATVSTFTDQPGKEVEIKVWDVGTGKELFTAAGPAANGVGVVFSPLQEQLAVAAPGQSLRVFHAATGAPVKEFAYHGEVVKSGENIDALAISADGTRVAVARPAGVTLILASVQKGNVQWWTVPLKGHAGPVSALAWSGNGGRLAVASGGQVTVWATLDRRGVPEPRRLTVFRGGRLDLRAAALSRDGRRLALAQGKEVAVWNVDTGEVLLPLRGQATLITALAFSDDGGRIASGGLNGTVLIWDGTPRPEAAPAK
jgi:WD40 repeat protein